MIYDGSKTQLGEVARGYPELKRVIWIPTEAEICDELSLQFGVGDTVSVTAWHHITTGVERSSLPDGKPANVTPDIVMFWQKEAGDPGRCFAIPQRCMVAAIGASIFDLPQSQRLKETDLFLSAEHLSYSYALVITLAALFSNTPIALTTRASPKADLAVITRYISPTVILASSASVTETHHRTIGMPVSRVPFEVIADVLRQIKLDSGVIPPGNRLAYLTPPLLGGDPNALRLVYTSHPLDTKADVMMTRALMWLRINTGARFVYTLTSINVAGAVTQSGAFDYRHDENAERSHLGPPASSIELKLRAVNPWWAMLSTMVPLTAGTAAPVTVGEVIVSLTISRGGGSTDHGFS